MDLLARRRAQHLDDLHQLVDAALTREERLPQHQLRDHAPNRPNVDRRRVVCRAKDELRRAVVARADVRDVRLTLDQLLCGSKVAQLERMRVGVDQQVLGLDVCRGRAGHGRASVGGAGHGAVVGGEGVGAGNCVQAIQHLAAAACHCARLQESQYLCTRLASLR
eukprot:366501-Chlamydomonas_euryale.AAC.33